MFQDKAQSAVNGHSLNKDCTNPPGADWDSRRLARRVDVMDGIHSAVLGDLWASLRACHVMIVGAAWPRLSHPSRHSRSYRSITSVPLQALKSSHWGQVDTV